MEFTWKNSSHDEVLSFLKAPTPQATKKRVAAYERLLLGESREDHLKKTYLSIAEGAKEEQTLPSPSGAGVRIFEIELETDAQLTLYFLQNAPSPETHLTLLSIKLGKRARLISYAGVFAGTHTSFIQDTVLQGEGSEVTQKTIFFGDDRQVFDMFSTTLLAAPDTRAYVESKGVLTRQAVASFDGGIEIAQNARGADAHLVEHTLLLSPEARMNAIPGLTIGTNDVRASHSAGVTRVDDEQLFFAASRGIPEKEATFLIVDGFMAAPVAQTPFEEIVRGVVESRIGG